MTKRLVLKKDTLGELRTDELQAVVGGQETPSFKGCWTPVILTLPLDNCVSVAISGGVWCTPTE